MSRINGPKPGEIVEYHPQTDREVRGNDLDTPKRAVIIRAGKDNPWLVTLSVGALIRQDVEHYERRIGDPGPRRPTWQYPEGPVEKVPLEEVLPPEEPPKSTKKAVKKAKKAKEAS